MITTRIRRGARLGRFARHLGALIAFLAAASLGSAQTPARPRRVLFLYGHSPNATAVKLFSEGLQQAVKSESALSVEFYPELLDLDRFPEPERQEQLLRYIADKYRGLPLDAILTEGARALEFTTLRLREVFPDLPVVYGNAFEPLGSVHLPANVTGRSQPAPFAGTFELARALQPDAERAVIVGGRSVQDSVQMGAAIRDITPLLGGMQLEVWRDWSYDSLLDRLRALPPRTFVLFSSSQRDQRGQQFTTGDLVASIAHVASVPVYGYVSNWVGDGIVGGMVWDMSDDGVRTGRLLIRVLERPVGTPLPPREVARTPLRVDWRQMERWGLSEDALPADAEIVFRPQTLWERYRDLILVTTAVIAAQAILISMLLLERRRRVAAQRVLEESKGHLAHIGRVATLGELAGTISHELRQPLAAIRAHAEAGKLLLSRNPPDVRYAREVFTDIVNDDTRASEVLGRIRALLRHRDRPARASVDLNELCQMTTDLLAGDARQRGVRLRLALEPDVPVITGDPVELQQVVLNLTINAMDAVQTTSGASEVVVGTSAGAGSVEVFVRDSGPGVPQEVRDRVFEPFYSTKTQGLGMGLAIVRSIVERHRGRVDADNHIGGGAIFRIQLPMDAPARVPTATV